MKDVARTRLLQTVDQKDQETPKPPFGQPYVEASGARKDVADIIDLAIKEHGRH
jgi:hypothetical protein